MSFIRLWFETMVWVLALVMLAVMNPLTTQPSLCVLHHLGFESCPGCGLGHSVSKAFHGQFFSSFETHPLGLFTILVLFIRIITLIKNNFHYQHLIKSKTHETLRNDA